MTKLEDITVGSSVKGIISNSTVTIVAVQWYGNNVLEITYKDSHGQPGNQMLLRDEEINLTVMDNSLPWSFDADGEQMKLASEAYRISLAHLFDPYLAVHTSSVEPLPHQISAVYQEMLPKLPLRYVLADDPGAGKTIMTGLFIKELIARGDLKRCLIVSPGSLVEQWQDELFSKFHLTFQILTNDRMESAVTGNVFNEVDFCICRLDKLARNEQLQEKLKVSEWDLIVCDEAHKMSATIWGGEVKYTKRFQLGKLLSNITKNFLLLTATPHNGKDEDFHLFLSLVDPDRFEGIHNTSEQTIDVSDVMRRLTKEELLKFDGTPLFPERIAYTVNYCWLMVPFIDQYGDMKAIQWEISDLGGGQDSIVAKAARKMLQSDQVITRWAPALLQMTLDELLWKDTENISVKKLWEYLCTYCYLPRLSSYSVLQETICQGCASDEYFGIAAAHNGERYVGLKWNQSIFNFNNTDLLVKPSAAKAQIKKEAEAQAAAGSQATSGGTSSGFTPSGSGMHTGTSSEGAGTPGGTGAATPPTAANRHFYMSADVDAVRVNRVISTYVDEIIRHLMQVEGANVQLKLEVEVNAPDGIPSSTVRTVSENCKTLKITDFGFDD